MGKDTFDIATPSGVMVLSIGSTSGASADLSSESRDALFFLLASLESGSATACELVDRLNAALSGRSAVDPPRSASESPLPYKFLESDIAAAFRRGDVKVEVRRRQAVAASKLPEPDSVPSPPPKQQKDDTLFEVRFVDETGQALGQFPASFVLGGETMEKTVSGAGIALVENVRPASATIETTDPAALEKVLDQRWTKFRAGKPAKEGNSREFVFVGRAIGPVDLKPVVPNRIVVKPPLGQLFVELRDKTGRVHHSRAKYEIDGPQKFSGETDEQGRLKLEDVFPGDYELKLTLEFFEGKDKQVDTHESQLVVLSPESGEPEVRFIGAVPRVLLARIQMLFDTNKAFLLPTALSSLQKVRDLYVVNTPCKLLVVGHADTKGSSDYNSKLSLERAEATIAFLKDDVDPWLAFYESGVEKAKRWGAPEDRLMIMAMPDFGTKPKGQDSVTWYQSTRKLQVDGVAGPETRKRLIEEYMSLDGASLEEAGLQIEAIAHGCGEHFPLDDGGEALEEAPPEEKRDPCDRRVELFFFDEEFGVLPAPPGTTSKAGSEQYPKWRKSVVATHVFEAGEVDAPQVTFVELADAHFRTDSAVVLPEGEDPSKADHESFTSIGVVATSLRFAQENGDKRVLVAGHADTTGDESYNQTLSEERAKCALALLVGDRESFKSLCHARHKVSDYKQILGWVGRAFDDLAFDCEPGVVDDNAATGVAPVKRFQRDYNTNRAALGAPGPDLAVDGDVGPLTWGAFFDCYEHALRTELGEDAAGVASLREQLVFVDDARRSLGFGEHFPIEELGADNYRSQTNRRVEILFFDPGEEPDLAHAEEDPETSELYLPGMYGRIAVDPLISAKPWRARWRASAASSSIPGDLVLEAPGAPDGTAIEFFVTCLMTSETKVVPAVCTGGQALAAFTEFEDLIATVQLQDFGEDTFPAVEYTFEADGGGRRIESRNVLTFEDRLELTIAVNLDSDDSADITELPYKLVTLLGERHASTKDVEGTSATVTEPLLPPGGVTLLVESANAAGTENGGQAIR